MQLTTTTQQPMTQEKMDLLNSTICKDLTKAEMEFFSQVCSSKQLDPFSNQIYAIKRGGRLTFQVAIDGLRAMAERTGEYDGQEDPVWFDSEGKQHYIWLDQNNPPVACRVGIFRKGMTRPIRAIVTLKEFSSSVNPLWKNMPSHLLAKCAEAGALRKAFPQVCGGMYEKDEMLKEHEESKDQENNVVAAKFNVVDTTEEKKPTALALFVKEFERVTEGMDQDQKKDFLMENFDTKTFQVFTKMPEDIINNFTEILRKK